MSERPHGHLRIGELSQRTGVSPELLRAWERRYGLLRPDRSTGGFRLYSAADEARVHRMQGHLARGIAAAEAARLAGSAEDPEPFPGSSLATLRNELGAALSRFEETPAHASLDRAFDTFTLDRVITDLLLPYLEELGERWERGEVTVAQEHFASNLIRGRVLSISRGWDAGYGPRALLACPEGELHDLALVLFGVALHQRGWRITLLGANTPMATVAATASDIDPDAIVIAATDTRLLAQERGSLEELASRFRVFLAGRGADGLSKEIGAELFDDDPVAAAERLAAEDAR